MLASTQEMNLLEYEIERCWREGGATKIRLASKPDVSAWASARAYAVGLALLLLALHSRQKPTPHRHNPSMIPARTVEHVTQYTGEKSAPRPRDIPAAALASLTGPQIPGSLANKIPESLAYYDEARAQPE